MAAKICIFNRPHQNDDGISLNFHNSSKREAFKTIFCPQIPTKLLHILMESHTSHVTFVKFKDKNDILRFRLQNS